MKIRIDENKWNSLFETLWQQEDVESAGLIMGELVETPTGKIIVVRRALAIPENAYNVRRVDQISIDPIKLNRLIRPAKDNNWCVITVHTHPKAREAWFSKADDFGDARLMPSLHCQLPNLLHGSMVVVKDGKVKARIFDADSKTQEAFLWKVGNTIATDISNYGDGEQWFHRQALALGELGQLKLRNLRVGIVGLGGIGSLVSMQLAHLGIGHLVLIDGDIVEDSNVSRIVGATRNDVGKSYKVDVASRYAKGLGLTYSVESYEDYLSSKHEELIASCDVVVSCVDTHSPRALLNRYSYKYCIPLIDLGTVFRVNEKGRIASDAGRVVTVGPGKPCLGCWGHIDSDAIRMESMTENELKQQADEGYIQGAIIAQPSVVSFNTFVAGAGITEMLRLVTGFAGSDNPPNRLAFSFRDGVVKRNSLAAQSECKICGA